MEGVVVRPLGADDWSVVERLFGANGACGGCWCMYWRLPGGKVWAESKGERNRVAFRALVEAGEARGVLAFVDGEPVGWAAVVPREGLARVQRSRVLARDGAEGVWSLNCFYIPARWRGRGVATALLAGAVAYAASQGAREVEGYPVAVKDGRMPAAFAYTGVEGMFAAVGFRPLSERPRVWVRVVGSGAVEHRG